MKHRRKLLKALTIAGAAGGVEHWKKPVVNAVTLPAHAQISLCTIDIDFEINLSGAHTGGGAYEVSRGDEGVSSGGFEADSSTTRQYSFPVDPGTYLVCVEAGAEGPGGSSSGSVAISCCEDSWEGTFSASGEGGDGVGSCQVVVVGADGGCDLEEVEN